MNFGSRNHKSFETISGHEKNCVIRRRQMEEEGKSFGSRRLLCGVRDVIYK